MLKLILAYIKKYLSKSTTLTDNQYKATKLTSNQYHDDYDDYYPDNPI
jgi:hypothetical protein